MTSLRDPGFTLLEVAVALVVLTVAGAAAAGLLHEAARLGREADRRERLVWTVTELADSLGAEPDVTPGERTFGDGSRVVWDRDRVEVVPPGGGPAEMSIPVVPRTGRHTLGELR